MWKTVRIIKNLKRRGNWSAETELWMCFRLSRLFWHWIMCRWSGWCLKNSLLLFSKVTKSIPVLSRGSLALSEHSLRWNRLRRDRLLRHIRRRPVRFLLREISTFKGCSKRRNTLWLLIQICSDFSSRLLLPIRLRSSRSNQTLTSLKKLQQFWKISKKKGQKCLKKSKSSSLSRPLSPSVASSSLSSKSSSTIQSPQKSLGVLPNKW